MVKNITNITQSGESPKSLIHKKEKHHTLRTILLCENMILTNIPTSPPSHNQHPPTFP